MNKNLGVKCSYWKAWKARKCAHELIRGSAANSYPKLPSYLYMVQKSNPGTYTRLIVDEEQKDLTLTTVLSAGKSDNIVMLAYNSAAANSSDPLYTAKVENKAKIDFAELSFAAAAFSFSP